MIKRSTCAQPFGRDDKTDNRQRDQAQPYPLSELTSSCCLESASILYSCMQTQCEQRSAAFPGSSGVITGETVWSTSGKGQRVYPIARRRPRLTLPHAPHRRINRQQDYRQERRLASERRCRVPAGCSTVPLPRPREHRWSVPPWSGKRCMRATERRPRALLLRYELERSPS